MIKLEGENFYVSDFLKFRFIKFSAQTEDKILLTGRNGSGKTTFLKWLKRKTAAYMECQKGFYFDGTDFFFGNLSIQENLSLLNINLNQQVVKIFEPYLSRQIISLSAGEKVFLQVRALLQSSCPAIFLDDCLSYLDNEKFEEIESIIWHSSKLVVVCGQNFGKLKAPWIKYKIENDALQPDN